MILCVYEGERAEKNIFNNIRNVFFSNEDFCQIDLVGAPFCGCIYDLYQKLKKLDFEADIVQLLKEHLASINNNILAPYDRDCFSEVYLFFDFDPQRQPEKIEAAITEMLTFFSNETEYGKLYINYPMVESLKDLKKIHICSNNCFITFEKLKKYKELVSQRSDFQDYRKYNKEVWQHFCLQAIKKANCITYGNYQKINYDDFIHNLEQITIFEKQISNFYVHNKIAILNSIPLFLLEYFGSKKWNELLNTNEGLG